MTISSATIWFVRHFWMIDLSELWISTEHSTNHFWVMVLIKNRQFNSQKRHFFFSMIWYNHTFGQICILDRTISQMIDVVHGLLFSEFHKILIQFVGFFLFQIPSSTPYLQSMNYSRTSHPTRSGLLYRLHHLSSLHTPTTLYLHSTLTPNKTRNLWFQNNNTNTTDHPTAQCELQIITINLENSRPEQWI